MRLLSGLRRRGRWRPADILFFVHDDKRWDTIALIIKALKLRHPALRLRIVAAAQAPLPSSDLDFCGVEILISHSLHELPLFEAAVMYTPIVGHLSMFRPRNGRIVHAAWSMASLDGVYEANAFDGYDYVLCAGPHHMQSFAEWGRERRTYSGKRLIPAGYPKLDLMLQSVADQRPAAEPRARLTVIYAPTHCYGPNVGLASLREYGEAIINALLEAGHRVIFRPHPTSFIDGDQTLIDGICRLHQDNEAFVLDDKIDYSSSYAAADIMITDVSGSGFTFSFTYCRPCIFFFPNVEAERGLRGIQYEARHRIGGVVRDIPQLVQSVANFARQDIAAQITAYRDETIFRVGTSADYIADSLASICAGKDRDEWVRL